MSHTFWRKNCTVSETISFYISVCILTWLCISHMTHTRAGRLTTIASSLIYFLFLLNRRQRKRKQFRHVWAFPVFIAVLFRTKDVNCAPSGIRVYFNLFGEKYRCEKRPKNVPNKAPHVNISKLVDKLFKMWLHSTEMTALKHAWSIDQL